MIRVVADACVVLDVLQRRRGFVEDAWKVFTSVFSASVEGYVTADAVTNIFYLVRKRYAEQKVADPVSTAKHAVSMVLEFFDVLDTTGEDCRRALAAPSSDFEDAVAVEVALRHRVDGIVTRDLKGFRHCPLPVMTPGEYLELIRSSPN